MWVQSKSGTEFFSTSTDGQVLWWDYRKLAAPLEQMWIDPTKKQEKAHAEGGLCLDFEPSMVRTGVSQPPQTDPRDAASRASSCRDIDRWIDKSQKSLSASVAK